MPGTYFVSTPTDNQLRQHLENIKTVANLTNNKDVFMCILRFHALAGYLQTYENLLKEICILALRLWRTTSIK